MRTHRTSRRLTNRTDVTGPAATGIHPNCIRSLRDTASRLPRVDTLRRSSLPKFHDLAECGPRALAAQLRRRAPALRPVAVGRGPSRCALRAAPPAARCRAVRPEKDRDRDTPARRLRHLPASALQGQRSRVARRLWGRARQRRQRGRVRAQRSGAARRRRRQRGRRQRGAACFDLAGLRNEPISEPARDGRGRRTGAALRVDALRGTP